jgi:signal transduction histidine kinase/DNA-binding NarL/FixJ family response regulator
VVNEEANFTRVDSSGGIVRMSSAPVRNSDGAITAGLLICEDITQHRRLQEEQARMQVVEVAAQQTRALVSNVSHELRTPLNGIIGVTSLLGQSDLSEEQAEYVRVIHESSKLLLTVIGDILDFSRIEAGMLDLEAIPFPPTAVVQDVMALMAQIAVEKGVDMQLQVADDMPPCVIGDPERLKQCLFNLCSNAVKFTPANGSVTLTCGNATSAGVTNAGGSTADVSSLPASDVSGSSASKADAIANSGRVRSPVPTSATCAAINAPCSACGARCSFAADSSSLPICLQFSVRDTGLGMSAEAMARCFKPFAQADVSTTRRFGGTGLGLAITRQLVTLMGGEVGVESEEGRGSIFTFTVRVGACTSAQVATGGSGAGKAAAIGSAVSRTPFPASEFASAPCIGCSLHTPVVPSEVSAEPALGASARAPTSSLETIPAFFVNEEGSTVFQPPASCGSPPLSVRSAAGCAELCSQPPHVTPAAASLRRPQVASPAPALDQPPGHVEDVVPTGVNASAAVSHAARAGPPAPQMSGVSACALPVDLLGGGGSARTLRVATLPDHATSGLASSTDAPAASSAVRLHSGTLLQQTIRILLAEDNAVNSMIATRYLRNLGYANVVAVGDGQAAVAAVSNFDFHLVLMDCQMPVMDGYEATRRIRALPDPAKRGIPIIALTASALKADVDRCMAAGMDDHLSKPYLARDLALKLNVLLPPSARCSVPPAGLLRSRSHTSSSSSSSSSSGSSAFEVVAAPHSAGMVQDLPHTASSTGTTTASESNSRL